MKKKSLLFVVVILMITLLFAGCKKDEEKEVSCAIDPTQSKCEYMPGVKLEKLDSSIVGKYVLDSYTEVPDFGYEYNYFLLNENGEYETHIKVTGSETEEITKGAVFYSGNTLTFKFLVNNIVNTSTLTIENGQISFTENIGNTEVTFVYKLEAL